jgi:repressor LexA
MPRTELTIIEKAVRKRIAENLKRLTKGMTQYQLSEKTGIPQSTLSGYFAERSTPDPGRVQTIADALGVSKEEIDPRFSLTGVAAQKSNSIPILGRVVAGIPIEATEDVLGYVESAERTAKAGDCFALRIKGESMMPNICDGDIVIVKKQECVENGDIAIVLVNGNEATCKKVKFSENGVTLIGYNASVYEPHFYTNEEVKRLPLTIIGKVIELRRKL